jgi:hypothetical protein
MTGFNSKRDAAADKDALFEKLEVEQPAQEQNTITFRTSSDWVMRITADRRIEVNEGVEVTEAAKKVLEALQWMLKPAQEPVAWMWKDMRGQDVVSLFEPRLNSIPLYIIPPKRPWVELTDDEEIADFLGEEFHTMTESEERFFRLGMQASKEKNT